MFAYILEQGKITLNRVIFKKIRAGIEICAL